MTLWTTETVADALEVPRPPGESFSGVRTDSRALSVGSLFVALSGERFDGHDYLDAARVAGATGAVVRRGTAPVAGLTMFEVEDTLRAYGMLARHRRRIMTGPVLAITGTNGKTSTKEMMLALMRTRWKTHGTRSNNNNRVGVPLTILEAPDDTQALVLEAGANERGEIATLREIIEPTLSIITNVAAGHLEGFASVAGVLDEKLALLEKVPAGVVGECPSALPSRAREICPNILVAGLSADADVRPAQWELDADGCGRFEFEGETIQLHVPGEHQILNALLALAAARSVGLRGEVGPALSEVTIPGGRCEIVRRGSLLIVNDTYNANPASLRAALKLTKALRGHRRLVIVVGSMLELGADSEALHRNGAEAIEAMRPDLIGAIGAFVSPLEAVCDHSSDRLVTATDVEELGRALRRRLEGGELVLLKASRGVGLDRAIPFLTEN